MTMLKIGIMDFWKRVDEARQGTLDELSKGTGIPIGTIKNFRTRHTLPSLADTSAIAEYLNVSLDWLVLGKVVEKGSEDLNDVVAEYKKSDNLTKLLVQRTLGLI